MFFFFPSQELDPNWKRLSSLSDTVINLSAHRKIQLLPLVQKVVCAITPLCGTVGVIYKLQNNCEVVQCLNSECQTLWVNRLTPGLTLCRLSAVKTHNYCYDCPTIKLLCSHSKVQHSSNCTQLIWHDSFVHYIWLFIVYHMEGAQLRLPLLLCQHASDIFHINMYCRHHLFMVYTICGDTFFIYCIL